MYESPISLPHLCPTKAYHQTDWHLWEQAHILSHAWIPVADRSSLAKSGDFVTIACHGEEIQIRNFEGQVVALSNVCAHRHCLIDNRMRGNSTTMRCQYHGWEYGADGYTRKIPGAKEFAPIDREKLCIPRYATEWCGQLLFLRTNSTGKDLRTFLGPLYPKIENGFGDQWRCRLRMTFEYDANWKVPIENSLEAYHVPMIHPNTFVDRPSEAATDHEIGDSQTSFRTQMPFAAHSRLQAWFHRMERVIVRFLGRTVTGDYWQHHVYPNLLCSFTDAVSLCHVVVPVNEIRSRSYVWQFSVSPSQSWKRVVSWFWGKLEALVTQRILMEDLKLYPAIQRGLEASQSEGRLARSEERIHAFQSYLMSRFQLTYPIHAE